jgi:osmotically-inducible protein OsmY
MSEPSTSAVQRRAQEALTASPIFVLREVLVERVGESLLLSGCVDTFYHKQVAQELVRAVAGRTDVINCLEVQPQGAFSETEASFF